MKLVFRLPIIRFKIQQTVIASALVFGLGLTCSLFPNTAKSASDVENNTYPLVQHVWSENIFNTAKSEQKLVLLDLVADWCQFCLKMDKITYKDESVLTTLHKNFIFVKADVADFPDLAERYKDDGRPTTVIFDMNGNEVFKRVGYIKPQWMDWMLQAVAQDPHPNVK